MRKIKTVEDFDKALVKVRKNMKSKKTAKLLSNLYRNHKGDRPAACTWCDLKLFDS